MSSYLLTPETEFTGWRRVVRETENVGVTAALMAMMLLPVAEAVLRRTTHVGITGAIVIVQQLTLIVGMLGGAIAARDGRLLALSALTTVLHGHVKTAVTIFSQSFATAVSAFLCAASLQFVQSEIPAGHVIAYGIKSWYVQLLLPIGFGFLAALDRFAEVG